MGGVCMSGYILRGGEHNIVLRPDQVDRLVQAGNGDAALLYLALMRASGALSPQELQGRLHWSELRLDAAESALQELGLIERAVKKKMLPADEKATYSREELADLMEGSGEFKMLLDQAEDKLGKRLSVDGLQWFANLYDNMGMPADVIYLLLCHCIERYEKKYGPNRRPTPRQIWKEGCYWMERGLCDQESASRYLRDYADKQQKAVEYMQVLGLGMRRATPSEEKYISAWIEQGFSPESVALAYDKTIFYKQELNWRYLNGILRRWHENGWHSVDEIERGNANPVKNSGVEKEKKKDRMDQYMKW